MTQAQVTLKVSPAELQIIDDALRMYAYVNRYLHQPEGHEYPLKGFQHITRGGNPLALLLQANEIRKDIELK